MGPWYYFMIPQIVSLLTNKTKLVELGCGQGHLLRYLVEKQQIQERQIWAMDQSKTAVEFVKKRMPDAHVFTGDIYQLELEPETFNICLFMETIEHLEDPAPALKNIYSILAAGGWLFVSFPNFLHLPWLLVRVLSDLLNKPNWIVRQPVDKIYTVFGVIKLLKKAGFKFDHGIGSNYGPPVLYPLEKEWMTNGLNKLGLWWLSFHPILVFRKPQAAAPAQ
jgi:2-polyprenyl-3-methyl-5-hydroxy-6-metoxy-1,4-benzoquinol methylase